MPNFTISDSGLVISTRLFHLPTLDSFYMNLESHETENVEEGFDLKAERLFWINHPGFDSFINKMGESNFYSLHRVFLSYYEASHKLRYFWNYQLPVHLQLTATTGQELIETDIINLIEESLNARNINIYATVALKQATSIRNNEGRKIEMEQNSFQEYLWSTQMNEFFTTFRIPTFIKAHIENEDIFNSSYLFKGAIEKKEISLVLYEWANISSFSQADFIKRLSNILEVIKNDIQRHKTEYDKKSRFPHINELVYKLDHQINSNNHWRKCFFGIFNASDLLGAYSRHSSLPIININGVNISNNNSCKEVVTEWRNQKLLPNENQFNKLFQLWYFTTSYLVLNWLRLPHFSSRENE